MSFGLFNYPVSSQQLWLWRWCLGRIEGKDLLIWGRWGTGFVLVVGLVFWYRWLVKISNKKIAMMAVIFILLSPAVWVAVLSYPVEILKLVGLLGFISFVGKKLRWRWVLGIGLIWLLVLNLWSNSDRPTLLHKLSLVTASRQVNNRITNEDGLKERIEFPLVFRRLGYNKYMFVYKGVMDEVVKFIDWEAIFFADIHPAETKTVQIFVWPTAVLFFYGLMLLVRKKNNRVDGKRFLGLIMLAWFNFLFSSQELFLRFLLVVLPLSWVMAITVSWSVEKFRQGFVWSGWLWLVVVLVFYGAGVAWRDINKRPEYWLNNRPMVYNIFFSGLEGIDWNNYERVRVSSLVGSADEYCRFYRQDCEKFEFDSFNLIKDGVEPEVVYAGFLGEFIGPTVDNYFRSDWRQVVEGGLGIKIWWEEELYDTVAFRYSNTILVGAKK